MVAQGACFSALNKGGSIWHQRIGAPGATCGTSPPTLPASGGAYVSLHEAGSYSFAALTSTGHVVCWGGHLYSLVADCPTRGAYKAVRGGYRSFCAVWQDDSVDCWGTLSHIGKLSGSNWNHPYPEETGFVSLHSTWGAWAGLKADGSVKVWGEAVFGGDLSHSVNGGYSGTGDPPISNLTDVKRLYSCRSSFVAMKNDGSLVCWGIVHWRRT